MRRHLQLHSIIYFIRSLSAGRFRGSHLLTALLISGLASEKDELLFFTGILPLMPRALTSAR